MKKLLIAFAAATATTAALGAQIDPGATEFPWMNGARDARYKMKDHAGAVHVLEAYSISCSWCNRNAVQVDELAAKYAGDESVKVLDLGIDSRDSDYARWISAHSPNHPVVKDVNRAVFNALKQDSGIPQTFVLDCHGNLVDYTVGYWGAAEKAQLEQAIERAKQVSCD